MSSHRIAINTLATYSRSVFAAAVAIFSSRWVLGGMGAADFGLFSLIGSLIVFVMFLNNVLSGSTSRHFAFAIGKGDHDKVNKWFNASLCMHISLGTALAVLGWPVGEYVIRHILSIPPDRMQTCLWVFRFSLVSTFFAMASVPYFAMFGAKQHMTELAFWGVCQSVLSLATAFMLLHVSCDRLLFYAACMVACSVAVMLVQVWRASKLFAECRIVWRHMLDAARCREICGFASWNLIGSSGALLRNQGTAVLLNLFHGSTVNAAYGIANSVSAQALTFSQSMTSAMSPEMTATAGRGDQQRLLSLALRASKFSTLLALFFAIPLFVEMDYVLHLWLKNPPAHATVFCQIILATMLIDTITTGHVIAIGANGKIAGYHATTGVVVVSTLPLGYALQKVFFAPTAPLMAFIVTGIGVCMSRVLWGRSLLSLPPAAWASGVLLRILPVTGISTVAILTCRCWLPPSFLRLIACAVVGSITTAVASWYIALTHIERDHATTTIQKIAMKFRQTLNHFRKNKP